VEGLASIEAELECRMALNNPRDEYDLRLGLRYTSCWGDDENVLRLIREIGIDSGQIESYRDDASRRTHDLVMEHWTDILAVAECLLGSPFGELTYDEVADILAYEDAVRGVDLNNL
jgi:hypothetical protein